MLLTPTAAVPIPITLQHSNFQVASICSYAYCMASSIRSTLYSNDMDRTIITGRAIAAATAATAEAVMVRLAAFLQVLIHPLEHHGEIHALKGVAIIQAVQRFCGALMRLEGHNAAALPQKQ